MMYELLILYILVNALSKDGTYAGNDAIVAFARNHDLNIVIHQLFAPVWIVSGL